MSVFRVDSNTGELVRTAGHFERIEDGREEMRQGVETRWRLIRGEVFLVPDAGVDWVNMLQAGVPTQRIEQQMSEQALREPGVQVCEIDEITVDRATRVGSCNATLVGSLAEQRQRVRISDRFTRRNE